MTVWEEVVPWGSACSCVGSVVTGPPPSLSLPRSSCSTAHCHIPPCLLSVPGTSLTHCCSLLLARHSRTLSSLPDPGAAHLQDKFSRRGSSDPSWGTLREQSSGEISVPVLLSCFITTRRPRASPVGVRAFPLLIAMEPAQGCTLSPTPCWGWTALTDQVLSDRNVWVPHV